MLKISISYYHGNLKFDVDYTSTETSSFSSKGNLEDALDACNVPSELKEKAIEHFRDCDFPNFESE